MLFLRWPKASTSCQVANEDIPLEEIGTFLFYSLKSLMQTLEVEVGTMESLYLSDTVALGAEYLMEGG